MLIIVFILSTIAVFTTILDMICVFGAPTQAPPPNPRTPKGVPSFGNGTRLAVSRHPTTYD